MTSKQTYELNAQGIRCIDCTKFLVERERPEMELEGRCAHAYGTRYGHYLICRHFKPVRLSEEEMEPITLWLQTWTILNQAGN